MAATENNRKMLRYFLMSKLGLVEPLVRLQRRVDASNRRAVAKAETARTLERAV